MLPGRTRRITKLHVDEISLVDRPANREPFLLYKSEDGGAQEMTDDEAREEADIQVEELADLAKKGGSAKDAYLNDDGTFKDGFNGCMEYQQNEQGMDEESARKVCAFIGRRAGKIPAGKSEGGEVAKAERTPDVLARLADGGRTPASTARGLVKYDAGAVSATIDRILAMEKDSQAGINPDAGDAWSGGMTKPVGAETRQDVTQAIVTASQGFNPGAPNAGSQAAVDPEREEAWDASMVGPVGGERMSEVSASPTYGPTGSPLSQGGAPPANAQSVGQGQPSSGAQPLSVDYGPREPGSAPGGRSQAGIGPNGSGAKADDTPPK